MIETAKQIILLVGLFKSSEAYSTKCILPNTTTEWVEQGTCGEVYRIRTYEYYISSEYDILQKNWVKRFS